MAATSTAKNKTQQISGRVKQTVGVAVGDRDLENEGRIDELTANIKQASNRLVQAGNSLVKAFRI